MMNEADHAIAAWAATVERRDARIAALTERLTRAEAVVEACVVEWCDREGICPFCSYCKGTNQHNAECPLVVHGHIDQSGQRRKGDG